MAIKSQIRRGILGSLAIRMMASAVVGLVGCSATPASPQLQVDAVKSGTASVVVSVTSNTKFPSIGNSLTFSRLRADWIPSEAADREVMNGKPDNRYVQRIEVERVARDMAKDTALYVGELPEGDYDIERIILSPGQGRMVPPSARVNLGRLHSDGKTPIDLGRLVVTNFAGGDYLGRSETITDNQSLLKNFAPQKKNLFSEPTVKGWVSEKAEKDLVEQAALMRPFGLNRPTLTSSGHIVAGAAMGSVLIRQPDGVWRVLRNKSLATVMDVLPVETADVLMYAGGEFSSLWRAVPGGKQLDAIDTGNLPLGTVIFMAGNPKQGWYVTVQTGQRFQLFHSDRMEHGDWKLLRDEKLEFSFSAGQDKIWFWRTRQGMAYAMAQSGRIESLDFSTGQWRQAKVPKNHDIIDIRSDEDGNMTALTSPGGGVGGYFAGVWQSTDAGNTWVEIKTPYSININVPLKLSNHRMVAWPGPMGDGKQQISDDDGATWRPLGSMDRISTLMVLNNQVLLRFPHPTHYPTYDQVEVSMDGGQTWKVSR